MGLIWVRQDPGGGAHVGPMNFVTWGANPIQDNNIKRCGVLTHIVARDQLYKGFMISLLEFCERLFCSYFLIYVSIGSQYCTWQLSCRVLCKNYKLLGWISCTQWWYIFYKILLLGSWNFCKMFDRPSRLCCIQMLDQKRTILFGLNKPCTTLIVLMKNKHVFFSFVSFLNIERWCLYEYDRNE